MTLHTAVFLLSFVVLSPLLLRLDPPRSCLFVTPFPSFHCRVFLRSCEGAPLFRRIPFFSAFFCLLLIKRNNNSVIMILREKKKHEIKRPVVVTHRRFTSTEAPILGTIAS